MQPMSAAGCRIRLCRHPKHVPSHMDMLCRDSQQAELCEFGGVVGSHCADWSGLCHPHLYIVQHRGKLRQTDCQELHGQHVSAGDHPAGRVLRKRGARSAYFAHRADAPILDFGHQHYWNRVERFVVLMPSWAVPWRMRGDVGRQLRFLRFAVPSRSVFDWVWGNV